jgi:hypothetical protein
LEFKIKNVKLSISKIYIFITTALETYTTKENKFQKKSPKYQFRANNLFFYKKIKNTFLFSIPELFHHLNNHQKSYTYQWLRLALTQ